MRRVVVFVVVVDVIFFLTFNLAGPTIFFYDLFNCSGINGRVSEKRFPYSFRNDLLFLFVTLFFIIHMAREMK